MRNVVAGTKRAAAAPGSNARHDLVRYLDIRINVPYCVQSFQSLEQMHHQLGRLPGQRRGYRGALGHLGGRRREPATGQDGAHRVELGRIGQHFDGAVRVGDDVFGAGFERCPPS